MDKKIALVTGANRGLGLGIARALGQKGITVLIGARNEDAGRKAATELVAEGIDATALVLDIVSPDSIAAAVSAVEAAYGRLDILINNAARVPSLTAPPLSPLDTPPNHAPSAAPAGLLLDYLNINLLAPVAVTQAFLPLLRRSSAGRIVNMSSSIGSITIMSEPRHTNGGDKPARLPYALTKAALDMFTVLLARELKETPIKVNSADPGLTRTDAGGPNAPYSVEEGARPAVWLATLDEDGPSGCFFTHFYQHQTVNPW